MVPLLRYKWLNCGPFLGYTLVHFLGIYNCPIVGFSSLLCFPDLKLWNCAENGTWSQNNYSFSVIGPVRDIYLSKNIEKGTYSWTLYISYVIENRIELTKIDHLIDELSRLRKPMTQTWLFGPKYRI